MNRLVRATYNRLPKSAKELIHFVYLHTWVLPGIHRTYRFLSLSDTFTRIYATKTWGEGSGPGSRGLVAEQYIEDVSGFIAARNIKSVVDLGCGDFHIGRQIVEQTGVDYTGVDIVSDLVEQHSGKFSNDRVRFMCANILTDELSMAELCLVRQVLQHLSNTEIGTALKNISKYPMTLISEDVPKHPRSFNRDKPHGPDYRGHWRSGVYLDRPPFSLTIDELWQRDLDITSILRTVLWRNEP